MEITSKFFRCEKGSQFNFYFIGDIHEGNVNHAEDEFLEAVEIVKQDNNGYWIGMGDYVEAITPKDKRFDPRAVDPKYSLNDLKDLPYKQIEHTYKKMAPIDDKALVLMLGNHELAYMQHNHSDVYDRFAEMFISEPIQLGYVGFLRCVFTTTEKKLPLMIALNHGIHGGGYREGYAMNKVHDVFRWTDADINVMGHIHQLQEDDKKITGVGEDGRLYKRRKYWGVSGCFLRTYNDGHPNYFENRGKFESDIGMLKAEVNVQDKLKITLTKIKLG